MIIPGGIPKSDYAKEAPLNLHQAKPSPKQLNFKKLSDAGGCKVNGCMTQAKPIFESRAVYLCWIKNNLMKGVAEERSSLVSI
jgi:hypothetical protein